ncbi:nitronate monooxygenase [Streptomyces thinghirensis]|nr:nitronate monooxygenase [Streptomyces thinghirensis]
MGIFALAAATTAEEARAVELSGADAVIAQGAEAGGHQGTHRDHPETGGAGTALLSLVAQVREAVSLPIVAAGGIMRGGQIAASSRPARAPPSSAPPSSPPPSPARTRCTSRR